ncbi:EamA family transporter [Pseudactinotalea suaedae]|uniref:EamA family transporter n=1 Tax=Pseudactinotalea suaedae TaxID=1524924 RepID=UPI0012E144FA|nr:DMT family transporter [Pseudactinotalea suaedae]
MRQRSTGAGMALALVSALAFGTSGAIAKGLLDAGWSPAAAVTARAAIAAVLLAVPASIAMRGRWRLLLTGWRTVLLFGVMAVGVTQLAYFQAVQHVSVGVALLLEYLGVLLVVLWLWLRHGQRPRPLSIAGGVVALVGLVGVLDVASGASVNPLGVVWGLIAAVGLATYFVTSADARTPIPPVALAAAGLLTGAVTLGLVGAIGILPMRFTAADVTLAGQSLPWWVLVGALGLISTAIAYSSGVGAARVLGSKVASFVGLTEVLFAVLIAWALLGQLPRPIQLVGGVLILAGVIAVKADERSGVSDVGVEPEPAIPDS